MQSIMTVRSPELPEIPKRRFYILENSEVSAIQRQRYDQPKEWPENPSFDQSSQRQNCGVSQESFRFTEPKAFISKSKIEVLVSKRRDPSTVMTAYNHNGNESSYAETREGFWKRRL